MCAVVVWASTCRAADEADSFVRLDDLVMSTVLGDEVSLGDFAGQFTVLAFLGNECPLAKLYASRLVELAASFGERGIVFLAVNSNCQDSIADTQRFYREYGLTFPLLKDPGNVLADRLGAERTPEVFVLDTERRVRYRGRIDDQFGIGYQRPQPTRRDLAEALNELLANQLVSLPRTAAPGCLIGRIRKPNPESPVTWSGQIAKIVQTHCQSCHREGQIAPFPLVDYEHVVGWAEMIGEVVEQFRMPPWHASGERGHFANDARLPEADRQAILTWVEQGAPLGNPAALPPPRQFTAGWQITEPDRVIYIGDEPVEIPATGTIDYRYFTVDPELNEDIWVREVECRPRNASVVHHLTAWIWMPGEPWIESFRHFLGGSALGWGHMQFPVGTARRIPAGAKIVFVLHYTATGTPQTDRSFMGLVLADREEVQRECWTVAADRTDFAIPPYAQNYEIEAWYEFDRPAHLVAMFPHMHLRGKSFRFVAHWPDGGEEMLLDVPRYDFNWQENYILATQKLLPAGTRVQCIGTYDNSADNADNPDPAATVVWGHQSWDEMMDGFMIVSSDIQTLNRPSTVGHSGWVSSGWTLFVGLMGLALVLLVPRVRAVRRRRAGIGSATQTAPRASWRWIVAALIVAVVPLVVLIDTRWALNAGWLPDSQVLVRVAMGAAWGVLLGLGLTVLFPGVRRWLGSHVPQVALAVGTLAITWLIVELAWGGLIGTRDRHLQPPGARYRLEPAPAFFYGIAGIAESAFNSQGLRGPELPSEKNIERILVVGGSTSEGLFLDDEETWPRRMAEALLAEDGAPTVWVGSAAATGCSLEDHMEFVRQHSLFDDVDCLVVLLGVHDLLAELLGETRDGKRQPMWYRSNTLHGCASYGRAEWPWGHWVTRPDESMKVDAAFRRSRRARTSIGSMH